MPDTPHIPSSPRLASGAFSAVSATLRRFIVFAIFLAGVLSLVGWTPAFAYTSPGAPTGYVNDFAHVLSANTKQSLEQELSTFDATTSNEIAVAIVPNMGGDYIENYAVKLFEDWKIGKAKQDNGVLLLLSIEERKMRIEVGYGLEGALPDSLAQSILDNEMTPLLKAGNYDGAVAAGVHAIEAATLGEYSAPPASYISEGLGDWTFDNIFYVVIAMIFIFQWVASILARSKSWWAGGIVGALAGISLGWFVAFPFAITAVFTIIFAIIGLFLDLIVSRTYRTHIGRGSTPPWWIGGGGFGGSSGGGGFGGFGGGSSGGGGASGGW